MSKWWYRLWEKWFPPKCCRTCAWSRDLGLEYTVRCLFGLGKGYGRAVWSDGVCEHYKKKRKD